MNALILYKIKHYDTHFSSFWKSLSKTNIAQSQIHLFTKDEFVIWRFASAWGLTGLPLWVPFCTRDSFRAHNCYAGLTMEQPCWGCRMHGHRPIASPWGVAAWWLCHVQISREGGHNSCVPISGDEMAPPAAAPCTDFRAALCASQLWGSDNGE